MERLTFVKGEHRWHQGRNPTPYSSRETFQSVCDRLGKIEDILGDEYDLDRLRELAQADREGRCVVLPESYYTAQAAARKASAPAEQSERGQATAWIMQRFGQMS